MTGYDLPTDAELPRALPTIAVGSPGDRLLRDALRALREVATDRETRDRMTEIIDGRRGAHDLLDLPGFAALADPGVRTFEERWESLSEADRDRARAEGEALLADDGLDLD